MSVIIGLTGQSGAGKTTVCEQLKKAGFGIINCDMVARECTADGSDCNKALSKLFPSCFDEKLSLDRKGISQIIFSDEQRLKEFDDIVYPYINRLIDKRISELSNSYDFIVLDAPTLFEAGADKKCNAIMKHHFKAAFNIFRLSSAESGNWRSEQYFDSILSAKYGYY